MRQYAAKPGQECKSKLIAGAGLERVRWISWYNQFWWLVQWNQGMHQGTNGAWDAFWKCQHRGNMDGQLIPNLGCSRWETFWSGHWCFPQWYRYGYGRGRPEWSWRYVSWKNLSKVLFRRTIISSICPQSGADKNVKESWPLGSPVVEPLQFSELDD